MKDLSQLECAVNSTTPSGSSLSQKVADWYFEPKGIERWQDGRIYECIGIKKFKNAAEYLGQLRGGRFPNKENNYFIWDRTPVGIKKFERQTRINEGIHFVGIAVASTVYSASAPLEDTYVSVACGSLFVILFAINTYALLLQRYNRRRIYGVLGKKSRRVK